MHIFGRVRTPRPPGESTRLQILKCDRIAFNDRDVIQNKCLILSFSNCIFKIYNNKNCKLVLKNNCILECMALSVFSALASRPKLFRPALSNLVQEYIK